MNEFALPLKRDEAISLKLVSDTNVVKSPTPLFLITYASERAGYIRSYDLASLRSLNHELM